MPEENENNGCSFDLEKIRQLVRLMEKHDLSEIHLKNGKEQWRFRRGAETVAVASPVASAPPVVAAAPAETPSAPSKSDPPASKPAAADNAIYITAPAPGTFYLAPNPDDPPFVQVGDNVSPEKTVCLIEAMKVFNNIPAKVSGTIAEILVADGDAVEFGQNLFRVTP